jgi:hypothetical protein
MGASSVGVILQIEDDRGCAVRTVGARVLRRLVKVADGVEQHGRAARNTGSACVVALICSKVGQELRML